MSLEITQQRIKNYLENRPAIIEALSFLNEGVEVAFCVHGVHSGVVYRRGDKNIVEFRPYHNSIITFEFTVAGANQLLAQSGIELNNVFLFFLRQILAGSIRYQLGNNYSALFTSGYIRFFCACCQKLGLKVTALTWNELVKTSKALLQLIGRPT
jgi:hypothetical protein